MSTPPAPPAPAHSVGGTVMAAVPQEKWKHRSAHMFQDRRTTAAHLGLFHIEKSSRGGIVVHAFNPITWKQGRRTMSSRLLWATELDPTSNETKLCFVTIKYIDI